MRDIENSTLAELLMTKKHNGIIKIIDRVMDGYMKVIGDKWTLYVSNGVSDIAPMFVAHTDTVSDAKPKNFNYIHGTITNPKGVLGADDRAGCFGLYRLMEAQVEGYFLFTDEEEIGGIGATLFAESDIFEIIQPKISALIELDRRGSNDVATYGYDNYDLIGLFTDRDYKEAYGSYTDVVSLADNSDLACVNLSIGYYNEHSNKESLVVKEMNNTIAMLIIDLPIELYKTRFVAEDNLYDKTCDDTDTTAVLCDVCDSHAKLYDTVWGFVCEDCLGTEI